MKKNNFKSLAAVLSLAMAATAVPVNANAAAAPKITVNKKTVYSGKTASVTVKNLKKGYTVQFSSTEGGVNFKQKKVKATGKKVTTKFTVKAAKSIADNTKTKIKAVVKNASGKKVKTVNQTVTLKQLAKSLTVKDLVETTVQVGAEVNADATIAPAAAKGAYKKTFTSSDSSVLQVVNASNGLFKAVAPGSATISVTAVNDKNKVVEGSKTLTVTVVEAEAPDDTQKPDVTPGEDNTTTTPTGPAIITDYQLTLTAGGGKTSISADSKDSTDIDVLLKAPTDATINKDMAVAVQLVLGTRGVGSLSQEDITILWNEEKQGWYGTVKFTSATLTTAATSTLTASITSVINGPEGKDLKGYAANTLNLSLVPVQTTVADSEAVQAVDAVVENLDRITITFNKPVTREMFLLNDNSGKVANGINEQDVVNNRLPLYFEMYIKDRVSETDTKYPSVTYNNNGIPIIDDNGVPEVNKTSNLTENAKIDITQQDVVDILSVSGNDRALTFVLANDRLPSNSTRDNKVFTDNSKFLVTFIDRHGNQTSEGHCTNYISDTTTPNVMTVRQNDMKSIIITFDQPVYSAADWALANGSQQDSTYSNIDVVNKKLANIAALNPNNYAIDGKRLSQTWGRSSVAGNSVRTYFGDPDWSNCSDKSVNVQERLGDAGKVKIELTDPIARNEVKITLGKDLDCSDNHKVKQCYFDQGSHVVQIFNVGDYAALTETGTNNCITTKNFNFTITANNADPNFDVKALSPEQFRITFNTQIAELEGIAIGEEFDLEKLLHMQLQFRDTTIDSSSTKEEERQKVAMTDFASVTNDSGVNMTNHDGNYGKRTGLGQKIKAVRIADTSDGNHQIKVEVTKDWTQLNNYKYNRKTYVNYDLRFTVLAGAGNYITNAANGRIKGDFSKNVADDIVKQPDIKTPTIDSIEQIREGKEYKITFSEPVQASNKILADSSNDYYAHAFTPAYRADIDKTVEIGTMTAEFYNKDTKRSYIGEITGWADIEDQSVYIVPETTSADTVNGLPSGNYTLIVRGVSDDVGNTSNTLTGEFSIGSTSSKFRVLSILADASIDANGASVLTKVTPGYADGSDGIYVEFSTMYREAPIEDSVLNTQNWTINGAALPVGSTIISGIDTTHGRITEGVTIYLPDGTLTNTDATLIKIGGNVKAQNGDSITGRTTFTTQSIFEESRLEKKGWINYYNSSTDSTPNYINGNADASNQKNE